MKVFRQLVVPFSVAAILVPTGGLVLAQQSNGQRIARSSSSALVNVGKSATLGKILVGAKGLTLYHRTADNTGKISCTGGCLSAWPPLLLPAGMKKPTAGKGVVDKLGAVSRPDISKTAKQVTYDGWALYYWAGVPGKLPGDTKPGQTNGQGIGHFIVVPPKPMVTFKINITNTGTTWGTVAIKGKYNGKSFSKSCGNQTCSYVFHAGVTLSLTQTATDSSSWPFQKWVVTSADGGVNKSSTASSIKVESNDSYTVDADYVLAG